MRRKRYVAALLAASAVFGGCLSVVSAAAPALAVPCTGASVGQQAFFWPDGNLYDVKGIRAPITIRKDGALCNNSSYPAAFDRTRISLDDFQSSGCSGAGEDCIVTIGQYRYYDEGGNNRDCLMWAKKGGTPVPFDCGNLGDHSRQYFTIHPWNNGTQYIIAWCHTYGDYTDAHCDTEDSSQAVYAQTQAGVVAEERVECGTHIFGSSGDQQTVGNSSDHVQAEGTGLDWKARMFTKVLDVSCSSDTGGPYHYHQDNGGEIMHFYDSRNAS